MQVQFELTKEFLERFQQAVDAISIMEKVEDVDAILVDEKSKDIIAAADAKKGELTSKK